MWRAAFPLFASHWDGDPDVRRCRIGDYNRYLAEFARPEELAELVSSAEKAYIEAEALATKELRSTHSMRLGVALNYSVFAYDVLKDAERAANIAKVAFDEALTELDGLSEEGYRESTMILQLLRDNLQLWASEIQAEAEAEQAAAEGNHFNTIRTPLYDTDRPAQTSRLFAWFPAWLRLSQVPYLSTYLTTS